MLTMDWDEFKELAEIHRQDKHFAMVHVGNFGTKALDMLCGPETYGDSYTFMVREGCKTDIRENKETCRTTSIDKGHLKLLGIDDKKIFISPSDLMEKNEKVANAIHLSNKLKSKLTAKQEPPTTGIKI